MNVKEASSEVTLNIAIGYEPQSINLTSGEWQAVQNGDTLIKCAEGIYEGEEFTYEWHFNDPKYPQSTLVVLYDDGEGYVGSIHDTWIG